MEGVTVRVVRRGRRAVNVYSFCCPECGLAGETESSYQVTGWQVEHGLLSNGTQLVGVAHRVVK